jgi:phosphate starvation-inducible protein PhoH
MQTDTRPQSAGESDTSSQQRSPIKQAVARDRLDFALARSSISFGMGHRFTPTMLFLDTAIGVEASDVRQEVVNRPRVLDAGEVIFVPGTLAQRSTNYSLKLGSYETRQCLIV